MGLNLGPVAAMTHMADAGRDIALDRSGNDVESKRGTVLPQPGRLPIL